MDGLGAGRLARRQRARGHGRAARRRPGPRCFGDELGGPVEVEFLATTEWDVNAVLRQIFAERLAHDAANELYERDPLASARHPLTWGQRIALLGTLAVVVAGFVLDPLMTADRHPAAPPTSASSWRSPSSW